MDRRTISPARRGQPVMWNGVRYKTLTAAAEANFITPSGMRARLDKGYTCDADMTGQGKYLSLCKPCEWNGVRYPSITAAAKARGVSHALMSLWRRKGYTCDGDVKPTGGPGVPIRYMGVVYPSIRAAARAHGVSTTKIRHYGERV